MRCNARLDAAFLIIVGRFLHGSGLLVPATHGNMDWTVCIFLKQARRNHLRKIPHNMLLDKSRQYALAQGQMKVSTSSPKEMRNDHLEPLSAEDAECGLLGGARREQFSRITKRAQRERLCHSWGDDKGVGLLVGGVCTFLVGAKCIGIPPHNLPRQSARTSCSMVTISKASPNGHDKASTMRPSSPKRNAKSRSAFVQAPAPIGSSQV